MLRKAVEILQRLGLKGVVRSFESRFLKKSIQSFSLVKNIVSNGNGLEIGGPSSIFEAENILPIYPYATYLDNCNFSHSTVWQEHIADTYEYDGNHASGRQYVLDATDLHMIKENTYDYLLASHVIEHIANPLGALKEWIRILKDGGHIILAIPHKDGTFDHNRPVTQLAHLIEDEKSGVTEEDLTHLDEILTLHDLSMDPDAGSKEEFAKRSAMNFENRCLHHHVFDTRSAIQVINHLGMQILAVDTLYPFHIVIVAKKQSESQVADNSQFLDDAFIRELRSPFPSDYQ